MKFAFAIVVIGLLFLLGAAQEIFAVSKCKDVQSGWKGSPNFSCEVTFQDQGGSDLATCQYKIVGKSDIVKWTTVSCSGEKSVNVTITANVGSSGDCQFQGENSCSIQLEAADGAGYVVQSASYFYNIDHTPPSVGADNQSSSWFQNRETTLSVSDTGGSGLPANPGRYSWDANNFDAACTTGGNGSFSDKSKIPVPSGSHRLYLCAKDNAGNVGTWGSEANQYNVDPNPPTISSFSVSPIYPPKSVTTGQPLLTVSWIVADTGGSHLKEVQIWRTFYDQSDCNGTNNSGCGWSVEQTVAAPVNSDSWDKTGKNAFVYSPADDGTYLYGIHVLDNANWDRTETQNDFSVQKVNIKLANSAPTLSSASLSPVSPFPANKQLTFTGYWTNPEQSEGEKVRLFVCKNNGVPSGNNCSGGAQQQWCVSGFSDTSPSTCNYTTQASDEGTKTYYAFACDDGRGSLCSVPISGTFLVDATAPVISVFNINPEAPNWANASNPAITISWTASDGGSGMKRYELWRAPDNNGNPGAWAVVAGKNNLSPTTTSTTDAPGNGVWWYGLHAVDNVENWSSQPGQGKKAQVDIDIPPKPTCLPAGGAFQNSVLVTCSESEGGVAIRYTENGTAPTASSPQYGGTFSLTNSETFTVATFDEAGNRSSSPDNAYVFTISHNQPPSASFNCAPASCTVYDSEILTFNNNSSDPDGSGDITTSEWDILSWGSSPDASCSGKCSHTLQPISPNTYTMQLKVIDSAGASDTDTRSFTVRRDIVAGFMCSLDNANFVACSSLSGTVSQGETLYLKDNSALSEYTVVSEGASTVTSRTWRINGNVFGGGSSNPSTAVPTSGTTTLELDARDNQSRSDTQTHTLNPQVPFPEFQEISPF